MSIVLGDIPSPEDLSLLKARVYSNSQKLVARDARRTLHSVNRGFVRLRGQIGVNKTQCLAVTAYRLGLYTLDKPLAPDLHLSPRLHEVLVMRAWGHPEAVIGESMGISVLTVKDYVRQMLKRLDTPGTVTLVMACVQQGLLNTEDVPWPTWLLAPESATTPLGALHRSLLTTRCADGTTEGQSLGNP